MIAMRVVDFVTVRSGGGKQIYSRAHATYTRALADADRAHSAGREVSILRRDRRETALPTRTNAHAGADHDV